MNVVVVVVVVVLVLVALVVVLFVCFVVVVVDLFILSSRLFLQKAIAPNGTKYVVGND